MLTLIVLGKLCLFLDVSLAMTTIESRPASGCSCCCCRSAARWRYSMVSFRTASRVKYFRDDVMVASSVSMTPCCGRRTIRNSSSGTCCKKTRRANGHGCARFNICSLPINRHLMFDDLAARLSAHRECIFATAAILVKLIFGHGRDYTRLLRICSHLFVAREKSANLRSNLSSLF